jgi:transglutaminase-like putative cysteine protease
VNLQRWLQLHTAILAVLGAGFLLLTGDESLFPYALGGSALIALVVTDWFGWIKVPRSVGNLAAVASVAWTFREFTRLTNNREAQLLAISHMLIYLQVVLVFQAKTRRVHWQLLVLSVLQVVVAAALSLGPQFGLLLTLYLATAIACMLLLCYERDVVEEEPLGPPPRKSPVSLHRLLDPPRQQLSERRQEQLEHWVRGPWLARCVGMFTLGSLAFATVFFFTAPRLNESVWQATRGRQSVSGFSGEVVLKPRGKITLSEQPVMRVSFRRPDSLRALSLTNEPYFHGRVLTTYAPLEGNGQWFFRSTYSPEQPLRYHACEEAAPGDLVRQDILIDEPRPRFLFAMMPVKRLPETPRAVVERRQSPRLFLQDEPVNPTREFSFSIGTLAIRNGRQLAAVPHFNPHETEAEKFAMGQERYDLQQFDAARFPGLKQLAEKVIREQRLQQESTLVRAVALRNYLFGSGNFQYSLEVDDAGLTPEQRQLDPVEQFVMHRRRGHCEYFASALVLMLRSQNIPARMVVGYKGGDWNSIGQYYLVRQKHAHAWVEVMLTADEVPLPEVAGVPSGGGAWYRLDPTPPSPEVNADDQPKVADIFDYADYLWRDYVVGLNSTRQEDVLDPLTGRSRDMLAAGELNPQNLRRWLQKRMTGPPRPAATAAIPQKVDETESAIWPWMAYITLFLIVIAAPGALVAAILGFRWLKRQIGPRQPADWQTAPAFFLTFRQILSRQGIALRSQATIPEVANSAAEQLTLPGTGQSLPAILRTVVSSYHRVRFGGGTLSTSEQAAVDMALATLQQARMNSATPSAE